MKNHADNEELCEAFQKEANARYERFRTDREDIDDLNEVADAMYECMQNRALEEQERGKGVNTPLEPRAQTGSTIFHRMVKQSASLGTQIINEADQPLRYEPVVTLDSFDSLAEGLDRAEQWNTALRWQMKRDDFKFKNQQFWNQVRKYGNIPVMFIWKKVKKRVAVRGETGKATWKDKTEQWPSLTILPWDSVYADRYGGPLETQGCVVVPTLVEFQELISEKEQWENWDKVVEQRSSLRWNQEHGSDFQKKLAENRNLTWQPSEMQQVLRWDVYMWAPVSDGKWGEDVPSALYWMTAIGNNLTSAIPLRLITDFDPDSEIPIKMIHALPDDPTLLYHTTPAQVVRSIYSSICTFWNLALDNGANINDPKRIVSPDVLLTNDMSKNVWQATNPDQAMKEFRPPDITPNMVNLINALVSEMLAANGWDLNTLGQAFGARTSASEAMNINRQSMVPALAEMRYVIDQFLPWYGRKFQRYMEAFAPEKMVIAITNLPTIRKIVPAELHGDFDVVANVVDEYAASITETATLQNFLMAVGGNPALQRSESHSVDIGELLRAIAKRAKLPDASRIILPAKGEDSRFAALTENVMLTDDDADTYVAPIQGQNHAVHLSVHRAKRLEFNGLEEQYPVAVGQLDQHILETEQLQMMEQAGQQQQQQGAMEQGEPPTEGQLAGRPMQEALGPAAGQGPMP